MKEPPVELISHLGRTIDPALPSNRHILALSGAFLAAAGLAGLLRPVPGDDAERALLEAAQPGECSVYGRIAAVLVTPFKQPAERVRVLRGVNALLTTTAVFSTWALARELLPDQPELAELAAALFSIQPAVWRLASRADPAAFDLLGTSGLLMVISRIATRSAGQLPTPLDNLWVAGGAAGVALLDRRLRPLLLLLALAAGYDAARDQAWQALILGVGTAAVAAAATAVLDAAGLICPAPPSALSTAALRALGATAALGLTGIGAALLLHGREDVRSRADNGAPLAAEAVWTARWLAIGWTVLRISRRDQRAALDTLAPLCVGAVAGVAAILRCFSGAGG
jgi:hypothetical protein